MRRPAGRGRFGGGRGRGRGGGGGVDGGRGGGRGPRGGRGGGRRGGRGRGGRGGLKGGSKVVVEPHRHAGVFVAKGKEDALCTSNMVLGESVYGEKRKNVQNEDGTKTECRVWNPFRSKLAAAVLGGVDDIWIVWPDQARILALNDDYFLKNGGNFVISIKTLLCLQSQFLLKWSRCCKESNSSRLSRSLSSPSNGTTPALLADTVFRRNGRLQ